MKKLVILAIIISISLLCASFACAQNSPSRYQASYEYYMSRGEKYLSDNHLESALESFERALIAQPDSEQARSKVRLVKEKLNSRKDPQAIRAREDAIAHAMEEAEKLKPAQKIDVPQEVYVKPAKQPVKQTPAKKGPPRLYTKVRPKADEIPPKVSQYIEVRKKSIDLELSQEYPSAKFAERKPGAVPAAGSFGSFYDEYLDPNKFSNGINDKIQEAGELTNSNIAPAKVSGEYRFALGATSEDLIFKDANSDNHNMPGDTSWRYIYGKDRHNSYDKKIYSRLKVDTDVPVTDKINAFGEMVIDPWTFVGKKRVFVQGSGGDDVEIDYKYWSNAGATLNETYRSVKGDIVNVGENKVQEGKTSAMTFTGLSDWGANKFSVPEYEIDRMYVPIRKAWVDYNDEPYHARVFAMAGEEEALTSDDPMRLSNNKVWWEESPWLDRYESSEVFQRPGKSAPSDFSGLKSPLKKGQWVRNLSFVSKDSDDQRLTFLRGASLDAAFDNGTSVDIVAATPRNLWDTYEQASSLPAAARIKISPSDNKLSLGALYTLKGGFRHDSLEALNSLFALDTSYALYPDTEFLAEGAISGTDIEEASGYNNDYTGYAGMIGLKNHGPIKITNDPADKYELKTSYTYMDEKFLPGLSNYRFTRKEFEFAKHIHFDDMRPENEAVEVGNGVDVGRNAFNISAKAEFPDKNAQGKVDFRTVYSNGNEFIENAYRLEGSYKPLPKLTVKGLAYYLALPETTKGYDPLINAKNSYSAFTDYFAYEDAWLKNDIVPEGMDPSIGAFSTGLKYDFCDYFSANGILEVTNDPKDWPRGLLNNVWVEDSYKDGVVWDKIVPFLYSQSTFGIPPYGYYGIYKTSFTYYPFDPIKLTLNYVYNDNKYAMALDDNSMHQSAELEYKPNNRLTIGLLYQYTRQQDLYKEFVLKQGDDFVGHHNIFGALDYVLNEDQHFTLMFGEYVGYNYLYPEEHGALSALDTRYIIRMIYSGSWGSPQNKQPQDALDTYMKPLGELNPAIPGAKFTANLYTGLAGYEEEASVDNAESDWNAYFNKVEFGLDAFDREYWEGSLRFGLFGSPEDTEKWVRTGSLEYQSNDMSLTGADINAAVGWAINSPSKYISFTPLLNAGYRRVEFRRPSIKTTGSGISRLGEVDEHMNVSFLGIGGRADWLASEKFNIYGSGYYAPLVYAPVRNSELGRLNYESGAIYHTELGCDYDFSDKFDISMGGFWDLQHLNRAERANSGVVNFELPDSNLNTFGLKLGGLYKF